MGFNILTMILRMLVTVKECETLQCVLFRKAGVK